VPSFQKIQFFKLQRWKLKGMSRGKKEVRGQKGGQEDKHKIERPKGRDNRKTMGGEGQNKTKEAKW
jgi:hypothetical protein